MSWDCFELGDSLYIDGGGDLAVKLATDSRISVDGTDGLYLDDDELTTDWIAWTPTFTVTFTLGNGTVEAYYMRFGQLIFWKIAIRLGSTSSMGVKGPYFTLPVPAASWGQVGTANQPLGYWLSSGGPAVYLGEIGQSGSTNSTVGDLSAAATYASGTVMSTIYPFTWATDDCWVGQGFYERA